MPSVTGCIYAKTGLLLYCMLSAMELSLSNWSFSIKSENKGVLNT